MPGCAQRTTRKNLLADRDQLLTDKDPKESDQRHQRRRRGADIQKAVNHPDQNTGFER
jgi:hypothetical protein